MVFVRQSGVDRPYAWSTAGIYPSGFGEISLIALSLR